MGPGFEICQQLAINSFTLVDESSSAGIGGLILVVISWYNRGGGGKCQCAQREYSHNKLRSILLLFFVRQVDQGRESAKIQLSFQSNPYRILLPLIPIWRLSLPGIIISKRPIQEVLLKFLQIEHDWRDVRLTIFITCSHPLPPFIIHNGYF